MDSRFKCNLWIISIFFFTFFMACSKDNEPRIIEDEIEDGTENEIEVNHPIFVSEAEQGDYKNTYSYERIDGKIRLKQIDLFKSGKKNYDLKLEYDDQNRLIECKRSLDILDYYCHENIILNDALPSIYSIRYSASQITVIDNDDDDENTNRRIYKLGSDGFIDEISWNSEGQSHIKTFQRSGTDIASCDLISRADDLSSKTSYTFKYDENNSVDYLRMMLPCLYSRHNLLREFGKVDGKETSKTTYSYECRSFNYPVTILKKVSVFNGFEEEPERIITTTTLKYINADNI